MYETPPKSLMFSVEERVEMMQRAVSGIPNVEIRRYTGLTVEFAAGLGAQAIVRGLRIGADFEYEREMALMNRAIGPNIEVICLISSLEHQFVSSTRVKEIAALGGDVSAFVPAHVAAALAGR